MKAYLARIKEQNNLEIVLEAWNINIEFHDIFNKTKNFVDNIFWKNKKHEIINFIKQHQNILKDFLSKNQNLILEIEKISNNKTKLSFIYSEILTELFSKIDLNVSYEWILDWNWETIFHEWLLRVNSEYNFNHIDLLEFCKISWKTLTIFNKMFLNIINDLNENKINWPISINAEVSDIMDPNFIPEIEKTINNYNINLQNQIIIIEILENQKIPNSKEFIDKILLLKNMWFSIAFDDIFSEKVWIKETIKNLEKLNYNIDLIKIDWKKIHDLYNIYKKSSESLFIKKCSSTIKLVQKKWIKVVAEWIETDDMSFFSKEILWVDLFQWYLFKK